MKRSSTAGIRIRENHYFLYVKQGIIMQCAPSSTDDDNFTCFNYEQLKKIATNYNKQQLVKKNKIRVSKDKKQL